jgi:cyclophilin family peptidyl-prolyl cis-trans isomerase
MMIWNRCKKKKQPFDRLRASGVGGALRRLGQILTVLFFLIGTNFTVAASAPPAPPASVKSDVALSPGEIVAAAPAGDWVAIVASDLLVMDLAPDAKAKPRRVVIQLMPPPFSQGWIGNIRKLAAAHWWDGTSVNRVQDNYVVQWGDVTEKKALPVGLAVTGEASYETPLEFHYLTIGFGNGGTPSGAAFPSFRPVSEKDVYSTATGFSKGWPVAASTPWPKSWKGMSRLERKPTSMKFWPVHCYGMVGVGRNLSPDTGSGAELYTVVGHAPRHLDRNIALVGRVIEGIEHLSSLPRGTGALGFYEKAEELVPIRSVRIASEMLSDKPLPRYEYLSTESESFAKYADARANRRDPFFIKPAGGADICNIPVPVRRVK